VYLEQPDLLTLHQQRKDPFPILYHTSAVSVCLPIHHKPDSTNPTPPGDLYSDPDDTKATVSGTPGKSRLPTHPFQHRELRNASF